MNGHIVLVIFILNVTYTMEALLEKNLSNKTTKYEFGTCGAMGKFGPTQFLCDSVYETTPVQVRVLEDDRFKGVQVWTVPENGTYFIHAQGAGGGNGVKTVKGSRGGFIEAKFTFMEGEDLYILVGQKGSSACSASVASAKVEEFCKTGLPESQLEDDNVYTMLGAGGGGGGGGASFVFKVNNKTGEITLLLVAGGGGGLAYRKVNEEENQLDPDCGKKLGGLGNSGYTHPLGAGGGGGYNGSTIFDQTGRSFLEGAIGGNSCRNATSILNWNTPGGFGGGGGACSSGGGGGGYSGGNASKDNSLDLNGEGGSSYVHPGAMEPKVYTGSKTNGFVEIHLLMNCQCQHICTIQSFQQKYYCECLNGKVLNPDGHSCSAEQAKVERMDMVYIIIIAVACTTILLIVAAIFICLVHQHKKRKNLEAVRMELVTASQSFTIRPTTTTSSLTNPVMQQRRMMAEYNPNYDFVGAKYPEQQLLELNRNKLRLVRALGQGAFGEVYKGYLASVPHREGELAVAVKTLPVYSTEEAELDFLMEAVIMSKFNHPNIVKFLGVCFENHPRYIILELLEGGDLKTFLREMRAKPGISPSPLSMSDLLKLAIDIAKGCQHLEERHFIHRDIAARNCLLTCKGKNRVAKIADFGMARDIYRSDYYKKGGKAMLPIKWMPPEAFLDGVFTTKTDVWSFGILFWEIFSMGYMPYPGRTNHDVMQYVTSGGRLEAPENCPTALYQLMSICWAAIPETRPNFSEIIEQLKRCSQNPEVLSADLPVFYMIPPSNKGLINTKASPDTQEDEEDHGNFFHESESKEPLLTPSPPCSEKVDIKDNSSEKCKYKKDQDNNKFPSLFVQLPTDLNLMKSSCDKSPSVSNRGSQSLSHDSFSSASQLHSCCDVTTQCGNQYQDVIKNSRCSAAVNPMRELGTTEDSNPLLSKSERLNCKKSDSDCKASANSEKQNVMSVDCWSEIINRPTRNSMNDSQKSATNILKKKNSANI